MKRNLFLSIVGLFGALLLTSCGIGNNAGGNRITQVAVTDDTARENPRNCHPSRASRLTGGQTATIVDNRTTNFSLFARPGTVRYGHDARFRGRLNVGLGGGQVIRRGCIPQRGFQQQRGFPQQRRYDPYRERSGTGARWTGVPNRPPLTNNRGLVNYNY